MKTTFFSMIILFCMNLSYAQDILTKNDSTKLATAIVEITPTQVKYKLFSYPDGPLITANKSEIAYITFKNGLVERFQKTVIIMPGYDPNKYNLDKVPVSTYDPEVKNKKCEKLYFRKNYIGFNYITFLNTALGFNYMRDIKKANLIINVPFAVGLASPAITNGLYSRQYLDNSGSTKYDLMKYQLGLSALFAPNMTREVNFLLGPSFNYTSYDMSVNTSVYVPSGVQYQNTRIEFKNKFGLHRSHYGVNIGFLARFSERFNMNMLLTVGYKQDSYSEQDPYRMEEIKTLYPNANNADMPENVMPYVNFAWSLGYRF